MFPAIELVAAMVTFALLPVAPTSNPVRSEKLIPVFGNVVAAKNDWPSMGFTVKVPVVLKFVGLAVSDCTNLFPWMRMFPVALPPLSAPMFDDEDDNLFSHTPRFPVRVMVPVEARMSALVTSRE